MKTPRTHSLMRQTDEQEPFLDSNPTRQETKVNKMLTTKQVTEYVDFLEILRKEDVLVKILKDPKFGKQVQIKSNPRVLPMSSSFPLSSSSRPARIDHKQREYWYTLKQNVAVLTLKQHKPIVTSHGSAHAVIKGFREIKKLLKNALKDLKHTKKKKKKKKKSKFSDVSRDDYVGRYSQLLEQSFRRNGGELSSRSLRLSYEDKNRDSRDDKPQFFRRISSLSSLEVLGSFLTDLSNDCSFRKSFDQDTNFGSLVRTEKEDKSDEEQEERSKEDHLDNKNHTTLQQDPDLVPKTGFLDNSAQKTQTVLSQGKLLNNISVDDCPTAKGLGLKPLEVYNHEEDACFCYVKKVLEVSGFLENKDNIEQWYEREETVNRSMKQSLKLTTNHMCISLTKAFSAGKRFLDEVWGRVEWSLTGLYRR